MPPTRLSSAQNRRRPAAGGRTGGTDQVSALRRGRHPPERNIRLLAKPLLVGLATLMGVGALVWGAFTVLFEPSGPSVTSGVQATPTGTDRPPRPTTPPGSPGAASSTVRPSPEPSRSPTYKERGSGTYTWAEGTSPRAGTEGRLVRYGVSLEGGTSLNVDAIAAEIDGILRDPRGWTRQGEASFQRVDSPPYDMLVHVVSPATTDKLCGAWGLDTRGQVNCANSPDLVVNARRWIELSDQYPNRPDDYHALIINHEVGHVLGHGHRTCPGPDEPAPAMMQQIKGLKGCRANPWVYDGEGRLIDGPPAP
ncbi:DUF3152 domain-containing protein [Streptomyces sp. NBC_00690]|uniref:DUF3152 domain-containing protein n=1 Tax=Streptomyces sp. NBC_00690 TaxID=2975808 RepID=UPI002E2C80D5|nr:DUF3152 domain-containing protein [Streptomyces sp. NBC_00690]